MNAAVIGDGGWGTALACILNANSHRVRVWSPFADYADTVNREHVNSRYLPGVSLPDSIHFGGDRDWAVEDAELCVLAIPTQYVPPVIESFKGRLTPHTTLVSVTKGLEENTGRCMTEVAESLLGLSPIAALSGPSHAEEVARGIPTAVTIACSDPKRADLLQQSFSNPTFRVYTSPDVKGIQLGGALKNVIAIAVGVSDGLGFGDNTRAALITRGLTEMARLGTALGADPQTFAGLSGMGDLIVTCTSRHSRNRGVGERIGKGEKAEDIVAGMQQVAEGVWNCHTAWTVAHRLGIDIPVTDEVYAIIHQGKNPKDAVASLMNRDLKPETD